MEQIAPINVISQVPPTHMTRPHIYDTHTTKSKTKLYMTAWIIVIPNRADGISGTHSIHHPLVCRVQNVSSCTLEIALCMFFIMHVLYQKCKNVTVCPQTVVAVYSHPCLRRSTRAMLAEFFYFWNGCGILWTTYLVKKNKHHRAVLKRQAVNTFPCG